MGAEDERKSRDAECCSDGIATWRDVFESLHVAVWLMDAEMRVRCANRATKTLLGIDPQEIAGRECWEILHGTAEPIPDCPVVKAMRARTSATTNLLVGGRWMEISGHPLLDDGGAVRAVVHTVADVNDRVRAQEELRRSEDNFRRMLSETGTGFVVIDSRGGVREANGPYARMAGFREPDEVVGRSVLEWTAPEAVAANAGAIDACATRGFIRDFETTYLRGDGTRARVLITSNGTEVDGETLLFSYCVDVSERRRVEEDLRRQKELAEILIETAPAFILVLDTEGRVVRFNPYMAEITGWAIEEARGLSWFETFLPAASREATRAQFAAAIGGENSGGRVDVVRTRDGRELQVEWHSKTMLDAAGTVAGLLAIGRDVTARERATAETRALLQATRAVVEEHDFAKLAGVALGICRQTIGAGCGWVTLYDSSERRSDLVVGTAGCAEAQAGTVPAELLAALGAAIEKNKAVLLDRSDPVLRHLGATANGRAIADLLIAPIRVGETAVGTIAIGDKPAGFDRKDARLAEAFGELLGTALQRNSAVKALEQSEERYRLLAENMDDVIWTTDLDLRFTYISPSHTRMSGYSVEESIGRRADSILTPASARLVAETIAEELRREAAGGADPRRTRRLEFEQVNKDGSTIWTEVNASFLRDEAGRVVGIMGVSRDMTDKRRVQASLAQADRLASMGMLAAGVAHEINNPLSYILYNLESLLMDLPRLAETNARLRATLASRLPEEEIAALASDGDRLFPPVMSSDVTERLREALSGADRVRSIVRGLGTFSRVEQIDIAPTEVRPSIEHAVSMARNEIKYRARLTTSYGLTPQVLASDGKLAQIVLNLLLNAAQSIPEGDAERNEIAVRSWAEGGDVFIEVADTGSGIPEELHERIFEPFYSTKPRGVGSGLGLSICRNLAREFHGEIRVHSEVGVGTRFAVRLPAMRETMGPRARDGGSASSAPPAAPGRILVVDDDAGIRRLLTRSLGTQHEVVAVASGAEAQDLLLEDPRFDVLLFDVMMPAITGLELHSWLAARIPELARRVVFMTGGAFTPRAAEYLGRLENARLEKPFDVGALAKMLGRRVADARGGGDGRRD